MLQVGKVVETFNAPIGEVWAVIAAIGTEKIWIEGVLKTSLQGAGLGALRTLTFAEYVAEEIIEELDPDTHRIVYRLKDPAAIPVKGAYGVMQLTAKAADKTQLDWNSYAEEIDGDIPALQNQISELYKQCCLNIKGLIDSD